VFLYKESMYIYLAGTDEVWYAAKILDKEQSVQVKRFTDSQIRKNRENLRKDKIFCFVELKTEEFKGRIAHLGETEHDTWAETPKIIETGLDPEDLKSLKNEVMAEGAPVPFALPKLINDIPV